MDFRQALDTAVGEITPQYIPAVPEEGSRSMAATCRDPRCVAEECPPGGCCVGFDCDDGTTRMYCHAHGTEYTR